jgi:hypothetical protein
VPESGVYRATAYIATDEIDLALEWLSRAARERDYWLLNIGVDPAFDRLRLRAEFGSDSARRRIADSRLIRSGQ